MQYILTKKEKKIPFYNVRKTVTPSKQPMAVIITFRGSEIESNGILLEDVMQNPKETLELKIYNEAGILMNTYYGYNKLDEVSYKYDCLISPYVPAIEAVKETVDGEGNIITPAIAGSEEIPEVRDTLITITLLKRDDLEYKIEDTNETVNAMAVAMAKIMGE